MYLFQMRDDKTISVMELVPKKEELKEFKERELELIDENKRMVDHVEYRHGRRLNSREAAMYCPHFKADKDIQGVGHSDTFEYRAITKQEERNFVRAYIDGNPDLISQLKLFRIVGTSGEEVTKTLYLAGVGNYTNDYRSACLPNLINITKSLYVVSCIETGRLHFLKGMDIEDELDYFDIKLVDSIDLDDINKLVKYGILADNSVEEVKQKVEENNFVLKYKK